MTGTRVLAGLLATAVADHPDQLALRAGEQSLTYRQLSDRVERIATDLAAAGVRSGDRLGVLLPRGIEAVLAIHAGLRLGAFVAPLDPSDPPHRLARTVAAGGLEHLLGQATAADWPAYRPAGDPELRLLSRLEPIPLPSGLDRDAGGYLLFTSGSTGHPKGVLLSQDAVAAFTTWAAAEVGLTGADRIAAQAAFTFDLSTFDLFAPLSAGACVDLVPDHLRLFPIDLAEWLAERGSTVLYAVPSLYVRLLSDAGLIDNWPPALTTLLFAGEAFPARELERYARQAPARVRLHNLYGPTETNVCTAERVERSWTAVDGVSIGVAVPEDEVLLLDDEGRPHPEQGEIAVAGRTLLLGYLQDGRLHDPTRELPYPDGMIRRSYLTGDYARRGPDGRLYLRGRRDDQIKRNGYRIDLNDIGAAVLEVDGVIEASVLQTGGRLIAYVCAPERDGESVLAALARLLPRRMLPDEVRVLAALPRNSRGKVDRAALTQA